jgi:sulfofructose kinase
MRDAAVLCLGATVFDRVLTVDSFSVAGIKIRARNWEERGGGPAATAAVCIAKLGSTVSLWSRVGDDHEGDAVLDALADAGVAIENVRVVPGATTLQSVVLVDRTGERLIVGHPDNVKSRMGGGHLLSGLKQAVASTQIVLADASWSEGTMAAFEAARGLGLPTVLDGDLGQGDPQILERMSNGADFAIYSEVGWNVLTGLGQPDIEAMRSVRARTGALPCVTMGNRGSAWLIDDELRIVPAIPVSIRDTTGAGDVFHGAFAVAYAVHRNTLRAAEFAAATAALKCQIGNGWKGMPSRPAIEHLMKENTQ